MFFYKKLSISPKMTHGDNYIFTVFYLIFYYRLWELANDAPRWATKQEQSYLFNIRLKIHKIFSCDSLFILYWSSWKNPL